MSVAFLQAGMRLLEPPQPPNTISCHTFVGLRGETFSQCGFNLYSSYYD